MNNETSILYPGRYLSLGLKGDWEYVIRQHQVVVMIAWTPASELLLVEQFRIPVGRWTIELPAGLVGDEQGRETESLIEAARRELEEETGWHAGKLRKLMRCPTSAGMTNEEVTFIEASDLVQTGTGGGDESEDILVHRIRRDEIDAWLIRRDREGRALDPKIFSALYWSGLSGQPPGDDDKETNQS